MKFEQIAVALSRHSTKSTELLASTPSLVPLLKPVSVIIKTEFPIKFHIEILCIFLFSQLLLSVNTHQNNKKVFLVEYWLTL